MANYQYSYSRVKQAEGGYNDSPEDRGNYYCTGSLAWVKGDYPNYYCDSGSIKFVGTNRGIAAPVLANYLGREVSVNDMKNLTAATAKAIFRQNFWNKIQGDIITDQYVADILFDGAVNHGVGRGVRLMQEVLGVPEDGVIGPITLDAINSSNPATIYTAYKNRRIQFYYQIVAARPSQQVFLAGWLNRMDEFNDYSTTVTTGNSTSFLVVTGLLVFFYFNR